MPHDPPSEPLWLTWLPQWLRYRIEAYPPLRKIAGNTGWLLLERLLNLVIRFVVAALVIRYLGPEQFGIYVYVLSFIALFAAFSTLGLDSIIIRAFTRARYSTGSILATGLVLRLGAALLTYGLIAVTIYSIEDDPLTRFAVLIVAGQLLFQAANVFDLWFQSQIQSKYVVWTRSLVSFLYSGTQLLFIVLRLPLFAFFVLYFAQSVFVAVGIFLCFRLANRSVQIQWQPSLSIARLLLRDAWPLLFASLSIAVYMRIDQVMLEYMVGVTAVGIYGAAVQVSEVWYFIPMALAKSLFPELVRIKDQSSSMLYKRRMQQFYDAMTTLSYAIIVPMVLVASPLVDFLFGPEYHDAAAILRVHIWALLFVALGTARSRWLVAENLVRFSMLATLSGALFNLGLNLLLIPHYEGLGAAWATLTAQVIAAYISSLMLRVTWNSFAQMSLSLLAPLRLAYRWTTQKS